MDLLGDIVEKEAVTPLEPTFQPIPTQNGFPKPLGISAFKRKQERKKSDEQKSEAAKSKDGYELDQSTGLKRLPKEKQKLDYSNLSEAEKIHLENIEILSNMSVEQRLKEKEELLDTVDPRILQKLLRRSERNQIKKTEHPEFEGNGDWIGGGKNGETWEESNYDSKTADQNTKANSTTDLASRNSSPSVDSSTGNKKAVRFDVSADQTPEENTPYQNDGWEEVDDIDDIAPPSYQVNEAAVNISTEEAIANVHFPKAPINDEEDYKLDINDPDFQKKLHEKYFPDLPIDTEKLKWMEPLPETDTSGLIFDNISDLRFDFKGDLIIPSTNNKIETHQGLHHHSENPSLAGYTLRELAHLSRSSVPGQRCIAIRTLGRILHKLGKGKYNIVPEFDQEEDEDGEYQANEEDLKTASTRFDQMFWGSIDELRIIDTLEEAADESLTKNLSVRNYAIEALWLWKQAGGNKRHAN